jgi:hypothetical protein
LRPSQWPIRGCIGGGNSPALESDPICAKPWRTQQQRTMPTGETGIRTAGFARRQLTALEYPLTRSSVGRACGSIGRARLHAVMEAQLLRGTALLVE